MERPIQFSKDQFLAMTPEARATAILSVLPDECKKSQPKQQTACVDQIAPMADFFGELPLAAESDLLLRMTPWLRNHFFKLMMPQKSEDDLTALILQFPVDQTPDLLARIFEMPRKDVLDLLGAVGGEKGAAILQAWDRRNDFVRWEVEASNKEGAARQLNHRALIQTCENFDGADPVYCMEAMRRKKESSRKGNGVLLPENKSGYKDLHTRSKSDDENWELTGKFLDSTTRAWREFHYVAKTRTYLQELTVDGRLFFSTKDQDQFFHYTVTGF